MNRCSECEYFTMHSDSHGFNDGLYETYYECDLDYDCIYEDEEPEYEDEEL